MNERVGLVGGRGGLEFEGGFLFEGTKQNGMGWIRQSLGLKSLAEDRVLLARRCSHSRELPLEIAKSLGLLRRLGVSR